MGTPDQLDRLRRHLRSLRAADPEAAEEARDTSPPMLASGMPIPIEDQIEMESIAMRRERPVLAIRENVTQLNFSDAADSKVWGDRLKRADAVLTKAIRAVGRIDLKGAGLDWVGTGWVVRDGILVTNRHVAREFVERQGEGFDFVMGEGGQVSASTDFLQEIDNPDVLRFRLVRPMYVEPEPGPDVAFFEIEMTSGDARLAGKIDLATRIEPSTSVAAIGYPAYDSRIPEPDLMERIYGRIYNKKRLAPGGVTAVQAERILHNCSTLGGNSGSVVFDFEKGEALGLHFSGRFLDTNYAVRADVVKRLPDETVGALPRRKAPPEIGPFARREFAKEGETSSAATTVATLTIPLKISISFDRAGLSVTEDNGGWQTMGGTDTAGRLIEREATVESYADRQGYDPDFLGEANRIALPEVVRDPADVLGFQDRGQYATELRYRHFSVVMSRSRRMCFFSACNINGQSSRPTDRTGWKTDSRIPKNFQIVEECYGKPPRFSRGHMTRREDPAWGPDDLSAQRGSDDSMHVTNVTPQMQTFNAPIWLALEDYALVNARKDGMKISVFTGPYFDENDPTMYGVRIPLRFWKVIAFLHDMTGKLCATGYEMDQKQSMQPESEFVFGQFESERLHKTTQVQIRSIERRSGLSFGQLASLDPLKEVAEGRRETTGIELSKLQDIRYHG